MHRRSLYTELLIMSIFNSLLRALKYIYNEHNGLEPIFTDNCLNNSTQNSIHVFKNQFSSNLIILKELKNTFQIQ